jgi:hypothetical protein
MQPAQTRYSIEEIAARGDEIYDHQIRDSVEPAHVGKVVAIDVDTGAYEMGENELQASRLLRQRLPDAQIWLLADGVPGAGCRVPGAANRIDGARPRGSSGPDQRDH